VLHCTALGTFSGASVQALTFYGNGQHYIGPQANWSGAFAGNASTGTYNLLSAPTTTGSVAPYNAYRVIGCKIRVRYVPATSNTIPTDMVVLPSCQSSYFGTAITQLREQPYAKNLSYPATSTAPPQEIVHHMFTQTMFGVSREAVLSEQNYSSSAGSNPPSPWFWNVVFSPIDGSSNFSGYWQVDLFHEVEFFSRNQLLSTAV